MLPLEIEQTPMGDQLLVAARGELDLATCAAFRQAMRELTRRGVGVQLDLSGVDFMDSQGAVALAEALDEARRDGWPVSLAPTLTPQVTRVLELLHMTRLHSPG